MIAQRLVLDGGYPNGIWRCPGCTAKLTEGVLEHPDDCGEVGRPSPPGPDDFITAAIAGAINAETGYVYQPGDRLLADIAEEAYKAAAPLITEADRATIANLRHALKEAGAEMDRRYQMGAAAERQRIVGRLREFAAKWPGARDYLTDLADLIGETP